MAPPDDDGGKDDDFASLLAEYEREQGAPRRRGYQPGEEVRGRIVSIGRDSAFVELGGKADGVIDLVELRDEHGHLTVKEGDEIAARVVESEGRSGAVVLKRALATGQNARAELEQAFAAGAPVEGVVRAVNKGGLEVAVAGVRAFCPLSQIELRHVDDPARYVGEKLQFRISKLEGSGARLNLVLSRRALLEEQARAGAAEARARLAPGAVARGRVVALKDFGAFVDLGGLEGMIHVSELGHRRVAHPKELLSVGQEVEVQVLRIEPSDDPRKPERVALSLKSLEADPWQGAGARFYEGARAAGTVARVESFGAFVELQPGIEGLLPSSAIGGRGARGAFKPGQAVQVVVESFDPERRRIGLALAPAGDDFEPPPAQEPAPRLGTLGDLLARAGDKKNKRRR